MSLSSVFLLYLTWCGRPRYCHKREWQIASFCRNVGPYCANTGLNKSCFNVICQRIVPWNQRENYIGFEKSNQPVLFPSHFNQRCKYSN